MMIDKKKIYRLLIILSWVVLVFYLLMKLLFGYTLEIVCNNEKILAICNFVDKHKPIKFIKGRDVKTEYYIAWNTHSMTTLLSKGVELL